ncbi:MAG TPA: transketolase [Candidatus Saccharimonadales bacterium]|nr:transketolase [Candidatus Saccharimonadales bacterium]
MTERASTTAAEQAAPYLPPDERSRLADAAYQIRRLTIEMVAYAQWGHMAGSTSMAELLAVLYWRTMRIDPVQPGWSQRDRLVLSKAHASPGLYAALALRGFYPIEDIYGYCEPDGILEGHADMTRTPGLESSGGLLGLGLSVAQGMAFAHRIRKAEGPRVFCILGDGELNEGNIWEAAMSAGAYRLRNLVAIVDYNRIMSKGPVAAFVTIEPLADKWRAFNWHVLEVDGHDLDAVAATLDEARSSGHDQPTVVIAHTIKGRGLVGAEDSHRWHTHAPDPATADALLRGLARMYGRPEEGYSRIDLPVKKEVFHV